MQLGAHSGKAAPVGGPPGPDAPLRKGRGLPVALGSHFKA